MAASATDKFRKTAPNFSTTIGADSLSSDSDQTCSLTSTTNLPTDTGVDLTYNRVDSDGVPTNNFETATGVVSSSNFTNQLRGQEGTAGSHDSGTVVEALFTAKMWNDHVDGILAEHNQDGTHKSALVTTLKATGAEVTTGTSDLKIVTPKALADSGIVKSTDGTFASDSDNKIPTEKAVKTYVGAHSGSVATDPIFDAAGDLVVGTGDNTAARLAIGALGTHLISTGSTAAWSSAVYKVGTLTRDLTTASGSVATTGLGFKPKMIIFIGNVANLANRNSYGVYDGSGYATIMYFTATSSSVSTTEAIYFGDGATWSHIATVSSLDSDGFTLSWTKSGSATGTANIAYIALR